MDFLLINVLIYSYFTTNIKKVFFNTIKSFFLRHNLNFDDKSDNKDIK